MRILFLTDYFHPYIHGGAETSIFELGKSLTVKGQTVHILTPNYGAQSEENMESVLIHRYFFPKKLDSFSSQLTFAWHFNPVYWTVLLIAIIKTARKFKIQVIHCQSVATVISAVIAGKILKIPIALTFRDAQILCNYGYCLTSNQFGKTCNLPDYFNEDLRHYIQDKMPNKNPLNYFLQICFAILGRIRVNILKRFARSCNLLVVSSHSQKRTFEVNGFNDVRIVHNIYRFPTKLQSPTKKRKTILYATKLSSGKGLDLLLAAFPKVLNVVPNVQLEVVGGGDINRYKMLCQKLGIEKNVIFLGRMENSEVMKVRRNSLLEITPSIYPESFGRSALEALACGLPVIASNRGGLTDIVEDDKTGFIVEPTTENLAAAIVSGLKSNRRLRANIIKDYSNLKRKFELQPVEKQIELYNSLL